MSLIKYSPLQKVTDHLFNSNIADFIGSDSVNNHPSVNIIDTDKAYRIELAAPGRSKEDFNINVEKDRLVISIEKREENISEGSKYTRREFSYASFKRSFNLGEHVDTTNISAAYENGVLLINVPKKEEAVFRKTIEIS